MKTGSPAWHISECRRIINEAHERREALNLNREMRRKYAANLVADETSFSHLATIQAKLNSMSLGG